VLSTGKLETSSGIEEAGALIEACAQAGINGDQGKLKARGRLWREVAEVGAIYPTQLLVNMLILKQIRN